MIRFLDAAELPASTSSGPESWSEAWAKAAGATDDTMRLVENTTADYDGLAEAYDRRIKAIEDITGQTLPNPMRQASDADRDRAEIIAQSLGGGGTAVSALDGDLQAAREEEFNARARAIAGNRLVDVERVLSTSVEETHNQVMRDAEKSALDALQSPELGMIGRLSAQLAGGLRGAARDPAQWGMAMFGAGGSTAKTVAGRIGQAMLTEFLINGGQELLLQGMSQERKRQAGLEHGMADMLANAGIAAVFGAAFGGSVEGGRALWSALRGGGRSVPEPSAASSPAEPDGAGTVTAAADEDGAAAMARVLDGQPQRGDVEALADAMGIELSADQRGMLQRSFEERVLDDYMISEDASPAQLEVLRAAERYAADPDNFPAPELVERMLAEQEAGRLLTMKPEDYDRIYGGDANAIDDIADTFFADDISGAARRIDGVKGDVQRLADELQDRRIRPDRAAEPLDDAAMRQAEERAGLTAAPQRSQRAPETTDRVLAEEDGPNSSSTPVERKVAPDRAEINLADIPEPKRDRNGNPENYLDFIAIEDGDGKVSIVSVREALDLADEPAFHADLLEACKL